MCGIDGYLTVGGTPLDETQLQARENILRALTWAMQTRGKESTGLALVDTDKGHIDIRKRAQNSTQFIHSEGTAKFYSQRRTWPIAIAHTRLSTTGKITKGNAHPYRYGDVVGCHNGMVMNHRELDQELKTTCEVDSMVIFKLLEQDPDPKSVAKKLEGSFAVNWYDQRTRTLNLARGGNPIHVAYIESMRTYFWCSEDVPLYSAIYAAGLDYMVVELKDNHIASIEVDSGTLTVQALEWGESRTSRSIITSRYGGTDWGEWDFEEGFGWQKKSKRSKVDNDPTQCSECPLPAIDYGFEGPPLCYGCIGDFGPCESCGEKGEYDERMETVVCEDCKEQLIYEMLQQAK